ncbi:hypothetical protein NDU88_005368 [Pleurodeles waltl]|uniref:Uncharacterized protein n=1 Tax=Pleurodeles waltl TaxID=8319 RepID=A0AAV7WA90_PLEWA|nr:hypothetical protein NDU88_005368 [Pleurodeles waltl]
MDQLPRRCVFHGSAVNIRACSTDQRSTFVHVVFTTAQRTCCAGARRATSASRPRRARGLRKSAQSGEAAAPQQPRSLRAETCKEPRPPKAFQHTLGSGRKKRKKKGERFSQAEGVLSPLSAVVRADTRGGRGVVLTRLR